MTIAKLGAQRARTVENETKKKEKKAREKEGGYHFGKKLMKWRRPQL